MVHRSSMPGTYRSYGYDILKGNYRLFMKNGKQVVAEGTIKPSGSQTIFKGKNPYGEKLHLTPDETDKISLWAGKSLIDFISFENKYWLAPAGEKLPNIYYALKFENIAVIREGDSLRQLSKDEVLQLVKGHAYAEKFVEKGEFDRAFAEYNGISTSMYRSGKKGKDSDKDE